MHLISAIFAVSCYFSSLGSAVYVKKRGAQTNSTLFAYGANASAWPIAYGNDDGCLYVTEDPSAQTGLVPLTWDLPSITQENWIVNATFDNGTSAGSLALLSEKDYAIGVVPTSSATDNAGLLVQGFALFATQLVYNNNTMLEAQFWASPGNKSDDGAYTLVWSVDQNTVAGSFPVVIKGTENAIQ